MTFHSHFASSPVNFSNFIDLVSLLHYLKIEALPSNHLSEPSRALPTGHSVNNYQLNSFIFLPWPFFTLQNALLFSFVVLATFVTLCNAQCYFIPNESSASNGKSWLFNVLLFDCISVNINYWQMNNLKSAWDRGLGQMYKWSKMRYFNIPFIWESGSQS